MIYQIQVYINLQHMSTLLQHQIFLSWSCLKSYKSTLTVYKSISQKGSNLDSVKKFDSTEILHEGMQIFSITNCRISAETG